MYYLCVHCKKQPNSFRAQIVLFFEEKKKHNYLQSVYVLYTTGKFSTSDVKSTSELKRHETIDTKLKPHTLCTVETRDLRISVILVHFTYSFYLHLTFFCGHTLSLNDLEKTPCC